jgi:hypothetical protein
MPMTGIPTAFDHRPPSVTETSAMPLSASTNSATPLRRLPFAGPLRNGGHLSEDASRVSVRCHPQLAEARSRAPSGRRSAFRPGTATFGGRPVAALLRATPSMAGRSLRSRAFGLCCDTRRRGSRDILSDAAVREGFYRRRLTRGPVVPAIVSIAFEAPTCEGLVAERWSACREQTP